MRTIGSPDAFPARATHGFTIEQHFDATPAAVFRAWTEPAELTWFLNPEQPTPAEPIEVDLRVGGAWRVPMVVDASTKYMTGGVYLEIVPDTRLVFAWGATDGWPLIDLADLSAGPIASLDLEAEGDGTLARLTVRLPETLSAAEARSWFDLGIREGWSETFARLRT